MMLRVASSILGAILVLSLQAAHVTATYWSAPVNATPEDGRTEMAPHLALAPDGSAWMVWGQRAVFARWNGDSWGPEAPLGADEDRVSNVWPDIGCGGDGSLWAIWDSVKRLSVYYEETRGLVSRWDGAGWSLPETLWVSSGQSFNYRIAPVSRDELWAVRPTGHLGGSIEAFHFEGGARSRYLLGDPSRADADPAVAVEADGTVWVAWVQQTDDPYSVRRRLVSTRFMNGAWEPYQTAGDPSPVSRIYLGIAQDDTKWLLTEEGQETFPYKQEIWARQWTGVGWGPRTRVSEPMTVADTTQGLLHVSSSCGGMPAAVWIKHSIFDVTRIEVMISRWDGNQWTWPETAGRRVDAGYILRPSVATSESATWVAYEKVIPPVWVSNVFTTRSIPAPSLEGIAEFAATSLHAGARLAWRLPTDLITMGLRLHRAAGPYGRGQVLPPAGSLVVAELPAARSHGGAHIDKVEEGGTYSYWLEVLLAEGPSAWLGPRPVSIPTATNDIARLGMRLGPRGTGILLFGAVPSDARARVAIYNVAGRLIRTIPVRSARESGGETSQFEINWDGRGRDGAVVADGVYFSRLEWGGSAKGQATAKVVLMR